MEAKIENHREAQISLHLSMMRILISLPCNTHHKDCINKIISPQDCLAIIVINGDDAVMRYPGGKGGCFRHLLNVMPPHSTYIELYAGGGALLRAKRAAPRSIAVDLDRSAIERLANLPGIEAVQADALEFLDRYPFRGGEFIYADPPYQKEARRSRRRLYRHDVDDTHHQALLDRMRQLPCAAMVSGLDTPLYREMLSDWHSMRFTSQGSGGVSEEVVWMNFQPGLLHDTSSIGKDFRAREGFRRRRSRWAERFKSMTIPEQQAILDDLHSVHLAALSGRPLC